MLWLTKVGRFTVEHLPYPYLTGSVESGGRPIGVLHTTEGDTIEGALAVFRQHFAPNWTLGRDRKRRIRVIQHAPIGTMGQALENDPGGVQTNRRALAQIEIVGHCQPVTWLPEPATLEALVALMVALNRHARIPFRHPTVARDAKLWNRSTGWVGHIDVPENAHHDPGALNYPKLFRLCAAVADDPLPLPPTRSKPKRHVPIVSKTGKLKRAKPPHDLPLPR